MRPRGNPTQQGTKLTQQGTKLTQQRSKIDGINTNFNFEVIFYNFLYIRGLRNTTIEIVRKK